jgi:hypothetical protein
MTTPSARKFARRGRRTGTLVVIAALLAASGAIRLGVGVAEALVPEGAEATAEAPAVPPSGQSSWCSAAIWPPAAIGIILKALPFEMAMIGGAAIGAFLIATT